MSPLQVCQGLCALESLNPPLLHRDVKPSNIFVDGGGHARVRLTDTFTDTYTRIHTQTHARDPVCFVGPFKHAHTHTHTHTFTLTHARTHRPRPQAYRRSGVVAWSSQCPGHLTRPLACPCCVDPPMLWPSQCPLCVCPSLLPAKQTAYPCCYCLCTTKSLGHILVPLVWADRWCCVCVSQVGDFGLSRRLTPDSMADLTGETGTYLYMAPEVMR